MRQWNEMKLIINGEPQSSTADTLHALVEQLGMKSDRVAIELNREIVPRERWPQTPLREGDRLEIVHFVGGGSPRSTSFLQSRTLSRALESSFPTC
jgi:sulfur carrier protein